MRSYIKPFCHREEAEGRRGDLVMWFSGEIVSSLSLLAMTENLFLR